MRFFGSGSTLGRRVVLSLGLAAVLGAALPAAAQTAPATPPAPQADPFKFSSDAAAIIWIIKPDQTQQFEDVWKVIRGRMATTDKPDLKALGDNLKVYKMPVVAGQPVQYLFIADPASKTLTYQPSPYLLFDSGLFPERKEATELFDKLSATIQGINPQPLVILK
jgi:hypothetical protein